MLFLFLASESIYAVGQWKPSDTLTGDQYTDDYWNGPPVFKVGDTVEILRSSVCIDQPSRGEGKMLSGDPPSPIGPVDEVLDPSYEWGDTITGGTDGHGPAVGTTADLIANRDFYAEVSQSSQTSPASPFNGTVGTGYGVLEDRPTTCTTGVGYWATDQGTWNPGNYGKGEGIFYTCTSPNVWTQNYEPYVYPDPLIAQTN